MQIASVTALVLMLPGAALLLLLERVLKVEYLVLPRPGVTPPRVSAWWREAMRAILGNRMTQEPARGE